MELKNINGFEALLNLSALAADFKMGVVDDDVVRQLLSAIVNSMDLSESERKALLRGALGYWMIRD